MVHGIYVSKETKISMWFAVVEITIVLLQAEARNICLVIERNACIREPIEPTNPSKKLD